MDKSMIPILVAMVAIVAAGAALALHGVGTEDGREPPSGYPPVLDGPEKEKTDPIDPENEEHVGSIWMSGPEVVIAGDQFEIIVKATGIDLGDVEVSLSMPFSYEIKYESGPRKMLVTIQSYGLWTDDLIVTAKAGAVSESMTVTPHHSTEVPGTSVPGASPAMEFYLELASGGSKAMDVPSEYLSLLSMAQWSSSVPSVCTVTADSGAGTVTAVAHKAGKCDLTASLGFYSAVCHVTVR